MEYYKTARAERDNDELALGSEPTEPLEPLLLYTQTLRDVPQQAGFPKLWSGLNARDPLCVYMAI